MAQSSNGREGAPVRRLSRLLMLGAALGTAAIATPAEARGGRAAAGRTGRAVSTPYGGAASVNRGAAVRTPSGGAAAVDRGAAVRTPYGGAAAVHQGRAVSTPRGTAYVGRTAVVRTGPRPYTRAPYAYGGRRYYAYRPYAYHRYAPFAWGPAFHPVGFFLATMAATAIVVTVANTRYHYDQGVWYEPASGGYRVVPAPIGATITTLPSGVVKVSETEYYYGGAYYQKTTEGYTVIAPQAGTVVENLPPGGEEVTVGDRKYVAFGDIYYQPIEEDGPKYEVVEVKADE